MTKLWVLLNWFSQTPNQGPTAVNRSAESDLSGAESKINRLAEAEFQDHILAHETVTKWADAVGDLGGHVAQQSFVLHPLDALGSSDPRTILNHRSSGLFTRQDTSMTSWLPFFAGLACPHSSQASSSTACHRHIGTIVCHHLSVGRYFLTSPLRRATPFVVMQFARLQGQLS